MRLSERRVIQFQNTILDFYRKRGRVFPWRPPSLKLRKGKAVDPYAILVSEVMLQQTQAERVVPFFNAFLRRFPTPRALTKASVGKVLKVWQGLGYNRRALYLKRAAEMIERLYGGVIPKEIEKIDALSGVGPYTARAVAVFAFGAALSFVETNIRAVYLHFFFKGRKKVRDEEILDLIARTLPNNKVRPSFQPPPAPTCLRAATHRQRLWRAGKVEPCSVREWYNALMDYGAMLKKTVCNPNARSARYVKQPAFRGSRRELRGKILQRAAQKGRITPADFTPRHLTLPVAEIFRDLVREGFLKKEGRTFIFA